MHSTRFSPVSKTAPSSDESSLRPLFRYRLFYIWAVVWGSLMTVIAATGYVISQLIVRRLGVFRWWSTFWARSIFVGIGVRIACKQLHELDCNASYVFVCNHQVLLDIPLTALAVKCPFAYVSKAGLARVPFLGQAIRYSPSVFVDRSNPRRSYESIKRAGEQIRNGTSVIIYPEGARSYERTMQPFMKGAFLLALEAGVPIVPITILDAYDVFNERKQLARPGVVHIVVGKPISLHGMTRSQLPVLMENVVRAIENQFDLEWN